jgi:hypothetical protein
MSVGRRRNGSINRVSEWLQNGFFGKVAKQLPLEQKRLPLAHGAGLKGPRLAGTGG